MALTKKASIALMVASLQEAGRSAYAQAIDRWVPTIAATERHDWKPRRCPAGRRRPRNAPRVPRAQRRTYVAHRSKQRRFTSTPAV